MHCKCFIKFQWRLLGCIGFYAQNIANYLEILLQVLTLIRLISDSVEKMRDAQIIKMIGTKMQCQFNSQQMKKVEGSDCPQYLLDIMHRCCEVDSSKRPIFRGGLRYNTFSKLPIHNYAAT